MLKKDLQSHAGVSWNVITKMSKGESVGMESLMKICQALQCDIGDIVEFINEEDNSPLNLKKNEKDQFLNLKNFDLF